MSAAEKREAAPAEKPKGKFKGFNGHALKCDCDSCAGQRIDAQLAKWKANGGVAQIDPSKTVFVGSFWRAQARHFSKMPASKALLVGRLRALARMRGGR